MNLLGSKIFAFAESESKPRPKSKNVNKDFQKIRKKNSVNQKL